VNTGNSKYEALNPKQYRNPNVQMIETKSIRKE